MERGIEVIIIGSAGAGSSTALHLAADNIGVIVVNDIKEAKQNPAFQPQPIVLERLPVFDDFVVVKPHNQKKWYEHYDKFKKRKK